MILNAKHTMQLLQLTKKLQVQYQDFPT